MKNSILILAIILFSLSAKSQTEIKKDYYGNGKIKSLTSFVDGKKDGIQTYYDKDGAIVLVTPWANDKKEGIEVYYKNGELLYEITYVDNKMNGVYNHYRKGTLYTVMIMVNGKLDRTILSVGEQEVEQAKVRNKERLANLDRFFLGVEKMETKAIPTSYSTNDGNGVNGTDAKKVERKIINADGSQQPQNNK